MLVQKLIILFSIFTISQSLRILVVFQFAAKSHYNLGSALARGLAEAGHEVTMISAYEDKNPPKNSKDIVLTGYAEDYRKFVETNDFFNTNYDSIWVLTKFIQRNQLICEKTITHPNVQKLLQSGEKFDVVIIEQFYSDALKAIAWHFNASLIMLSPMGSDNNVNALVANPAPPSYIPDAFLSYTSDMTFLQRVQNCFFITTMGVLNKVLHYPAHDALIKKYFSKDWHLDDINRNISLVLTTADISLQQAVPKVPNIINIGGFHVKPPKKLPEDLQNWLDNAKEGVVYFSLGSNLKSVNIPVPKRNAILNTLGKLKEKVLFKWEDETVPNLPRNIKVSKWFPQGDLLAHPNIKVFITHGGLLSTIESIYHGVPVFCIPVFGDQFLNSKTAQLQGYGLDHPLRDLTEDSFSRLLNNLLTDSKYKDNVQFRSRLMHDKQNKQMESAVFWTEYVVRHRGAPHLQVAGVKMSVYKYYLLDIYAAIFAMVILIYIGVKKIIALLISVIKGQPKTQPKQKGSKKKIN